MPDTPSSSKEGTPFVIDSKQKSRVTYGSAEPSFVANIPELNENGEQSTNILTGHQNNNNTLLTELRIQENQSTSTLYCLHGHSNIEVRDHCHQQRSEGIDIKARKKLVIASILCLLFMVAEIVGGVLSNSLAIATDAAHLLTDFASFMISLFAIWIAGRPSTQRMNFGWYRAEVIGALASVVMIWFITAILVWLAIQRIINQDFEVDAKIMLITSGLAILVNLIMGFQLQHGHSHGGMVGHGHSHKPKGAKKNSKKQKPPTTVTVIPTATTSKEINAETPFSYQNSVALEDEQSTVPHTNSQVRNTEHVQRKTAASENININVRAAFIHVIGDMVQSVGVFLAALVIYFRPDWAIADPICTFIFSVIVLFTTFTIMKDALLVLMEGTPNYMQFTEVLNTLESIEGVERVHNLRIWALSINKTALSCHLAIVPGASPKDILCQATAIVHQHYNFFETTIQIEELTPQMKNCQQCEVPKG